MTQPRFMLANYQVSYSRARNNPIDVTDSDLACLAEFGHSEQDIRNIRKERYRVQQTLSHGLTPEQEAQSELTKAHEAAASQPTPTASTQRADGYGGVLFKMAAEIRKDQSRELRVSLPEINRDAEDMLESRGLPEDEVLAFVLAMFDSMNVRNIERNKRIIALEARVKALEERPELKYCGTHVEGSEYSAGSLVTRGGALWLSEKFTQHYPGAGPSAITGWRLIAKS